MSAIASRLGSAALFQHLLPLVFIVGGTLAAIIPFAFHLLLNTPHYLLHPHSLSFKTLQDKFFFYTWRIMSPLLDPGDAPEKAPLLEMAYGVVLEIGPGVGDNIKYYARKQVSKLVLVEPNGNMHEALRSKAEAAGFREEDGSMVLLGCGGAASDEGALAGGGVVPESVDTLVAIHVLCGIPGPKDAIEMYRRLLKPGGLIVFYEHVRSEDPETARWQGAYTRYIWRVLFDGCEMDRATGDWILLGADAVAANGSTSAWKLRNDLDSPARRTRSGGKSVVKGRWKDFEINTPSGQPQFTCMPHVKGFAIKA